MGQYGHGRKTMHGGCSEYSIVSSKFLYTITKGLSKYKKALISVNTIHTDTGEYCTLLEQYCPLLISGILYLVHAREPLYSNSAVIAWWLQSTSAQNRVPYNL